MGCGSRQHTWWIQKTWYGAISFPQSESSDPLFQNIQILILVEKTRQTLYDSAQLPEVVRGSLENHKQSKLVKSSSLSITVSSHKQFPGVVFMATRHWQTCCAWICRTPVQKSSVAVPAIATPCGNKSHELRIPGVNRAHFCLPSSYCQSVNSIVSYWITLSEGVTTFMNLKHILS